MCMRCPPSTSGLLARWWRRPCRNSREAGAHAPEADGVAGAEPRAALDPDLVHEGAILRAQIGDPPAVVLLRQLGVVGGDVVVLQGDGTVGVPPDRRAGEQGEARPARQAVALRVE